MKYYFAVCGLAPWRCNGFNRFRQITELMSRVRDVIECCILTFHYPLSYLTHTKTYNFVKILQPRGRFSNINFSIAQGRQPRELHFIRTINFRNVLKKLVFLRRTELFI